MSADISRNQTTCLRRPDLSSGGLEDGWPGRVSRLSVLLNRPGYVWGVVGCLLAVHVGLLAWGAYRHSPTLNEPGHLVAGISHWEFGRFELYRVNPPLVRMVAALPVLAAGCETDWGAFYEAPGARPEFLVGEDFVAANGERSLWLFTLARWACIPFSLVGGLVCFLWGRELYGVGAGLLALMLWCIEPNILAHGQLITPDAAATAFGVLAGYLFWRWLKQPSWMRALAAGVGLGLAELAKMSWVILFGLWPLLWLVWLWHERRQPAGADDEPFSARYSVASVSWPRQLVQLGGILAFAVYVVNFGYGFDGPLTPLKEFSFVSESLAGAERSENKNRFAGTWLGSVPVPLPKQYLLGIDVQKRDFEDFGTPSYLGGESRERGWWYYYIYGLAIKVPLGMWLLLLLVFVLRSSGHTYAVLSKDELILLTFPVALLILVSSQTTFNHHLRYVLPVVPFMFIWIGQVAHQERSHVKSPLLATVAVLWFIGSSLWVYPHSLSYFNALAGGPKNGHAHLLHSNIDWGQDLLYLKQWMHDHPNAQPLYLAYYGFLDPRHLGIPYRLPPQKPNGADPEEWLNELKPGYYAISVNFVRGESRHVSDGDAEHRIIQRDAYIPFAQLRPIATAGYSIYIYRLHSDAAITRESEFGCRSWRMRPLPASLTTKHQH